MRLATSIRTNMHATMEDVARLAGVSLKSVSRVINREPHVSSKLRAKVEAAIAELNYVPDMAARSLAGARAFTIGVLFDNPSPNYVMKVQQGIYGACRDNQYHLRVDNLDSTAPHEEFVAQIAAILRNGRCDGFVLTPPLTDNFYLLDVLDNAGVQYVRIAPQVEPERSPGVWIDDAAGAAAVARHFWELGHRRYAILCGPPDHGAAVSRRQGFITELERLGLTEPVVEAYGKFAFEPGIHAGREVLSPTRRPTAIFATNDDSAAGLMSACSQMGLDVPRDVSVCGFDDSWVAKSVWPCLTTVHQPIEEMGRAAALLLLRREGQVNNLQKLEFHLVVRATTGPAPA